VNNTVGRRAAWAIAALSFLAMAAGAGFSVAYVTATGDYRPILSHQGLVPALTAAYAILAFLIIARYPQNPIGWLFGGTALLTGLNALSTGYSHYGSIGSGSLSVGVQVAKWVSSWVWVPAVFVPTMLVFFLFPRGQLPSRRWRVVAWVGGLGVLAFMGGIMLHPGPLEDLDVLEPNPFGIGGAGPMIETIISLSWLALGVGLLGSVAALVVRFRGARRVTREQMKWLVYAAGLMMAGFAISGMLSTIWPGVELAEEISIGLISLSVLTIAVGATIAIIRHRLYDIAIIVNRTLVYGALSAIVVGVYVLAVVSLGRIFQAQGSFGPSLLATGVVAVMVLPVRDRLQRAVNQLMYGEREDPYRVLSRLSHRLEATFAPGEVLPTIVETVAQTLKLPYAAIVLRDGHEFRTACEYGRPVSETFDLPLTYQGQAIGRLICARRNPAEHFTPAEERLLADIAHQAGVAVRAVQLTADLQRSRENLVTAREEERRRLRRDLHDGLGPALAGITLKLDAARNVLASDPAAADRMLADLKAQTQTAIADIRRLVYELRPPALDELGLISALREHIGALQTNGLHISLSAPDQLPALPAAIEVAAYRIAQEALTNVIRHARARECRVTISVGDALQVEVVDDGVGIADDTRAGIGLTSMRERTAELGGTCVVGPAPTRGTRVLARLPLPTS
jgi:signal transduction histidine kinase